MKKRWVKLVLTVLAAVSMSINAAEFKAAERTMDFGSKKLIVQPNGTFKIFSEGRLLLDFSFCTETPYQKNCIGNSSFKEPKKYDGGAFCLTEFKSDPATKSFISKGMVPYHKKGEKVNALEWKQVIKMLPDNKIDYTLVIPVPEGYKYRGTRTTFLTMPNAEGYTFDYGHKQLFTAKQPSTDVGKVITVNTLNPDDAFKINILCNGFFYSNIGVQKQLRIGLHPSLQFMNVHFIFDLMKCKEAAPHSEGGVDLVKVDNLHLTTTGKNMLPNPYFAQGLQFLMDNAGSEAVLCSDGAKFGKYFMRPDTSKQLQELQKWGAGWYMLAAVPGDKGKYTFSFYAKGKGQITIVVKAQEVNWNMASLPNTTFRIDSKEWQRFHYTFEKKNDGAIAVWFRFSSFGATDIPGVDGLQLEKGDKATDFSAEKVSARLITNPPDCFFESGKPMSAKLELSTLDSAKGTGKAVIRDFFGKIILTHNFKFNFKKGQYPIIDLPINGKLPDGIFVMEVTYDTGKKNTEYFRLGVMPWMNGRKRATANLFCIEYQGSHKDVWANNKHERYFKRLNQVGCASISDSRKIDQNQVNLYKKHGIYTGCIGFVTRTTAAMIRKIEPNTKVKPVDGQLYFYVHDPDSGLYSNIKALIVDYRLMGGWTPEYRKQFVNVIAKLTRRFQKASSYSMGSEWDQSIKGDPHYIDLYMAFREGVKSVYPDAKVYERGYCDMEPKAGTAFVEDFFVRAKKRGAISDFAATHTYVRPVTRLYDNFRTFVDMVNRTCGKNMKMTFPEGGHYYAYSIPQWNVPLVGWWSGDGNMWGSGTISYDLGNAEKLATAYYARFFLIFLTEFARVDQACSSCGNTHCFALDMELTPRAPQKAINTLALLFANPKRYLCDYTFAPESKCFIWEDETGCPLAAVWNEESAVELGYKKAPLTTINYKGAEYINIMGNKFKPQKDGVFELGAAPIYIRGRRGDFKNFIAAMSGASVNDASKLPCRMTFEIQNKSTLKLTINNMLGKKLNGAFTICGKSSPLAIPASGSQTLIIQLPKALKSGVMNKLDYPYECTINGIQGRGNLNLACFMVPKFKGDWNKVPSIKLTNATGKEKILSEKDLSASYQMAWTKEKMLLRVKVTDDIFAPGTKAHYRWYDDAVQLYFDTRCSALKTGKNAYDDDDYEFGLMPTADGKRCEVWRAIQPTIQLTLGIAAPKSNAFAPEIPAKFTRTKDGYLYEVEFPASYLLPIRFEPGYNFAFGMYVADRDKGASADKGLSLSTKEGAGCFNRPLHWPIAILTE